MTKKAENPPRRELPADRSEAFTLREAVAENHQARPG
jgi:hypothetical protein